MDDPKWNAGTAAYRQGNSGAVPGRIAETLEGAVLPKRFFNLFFGGGPRDVVPISRNREVVRVGETSRKELIGVDVALGEVLLASRSDDDASLINSSLEYFAVFLKVAQERFPYYKNATDDEDDDSEDEGLDVSIAAAQSLNSAFLQIDPRALFPGSYWTQFVDDVAIGDYGA